MRQRSNAEAERISQIRHCGIAPTVKKAQPDLITDRKNANKIGRRRPRDQSRSRLYGNTERTMLNNLSEQIRDCLEHAEECARKAAAQPDPTLKADFLDMEKRWRSLARSYEFSESLESFTSNTPKLNGHLSR